MSIKKGTMPPRYDDSFKSGAIKMVTEQGRPSKEVAAELGICVETLKSWLKRAGFQPGATDRQNRIDKRQRELEAEIRSLRKQLAEKYDALFVDAYSHFEKLCTESEPSEYSVDGIHLNAVGSEVLAKLWVDTLVQKGILK